MEKIELKMTKLERVQFIQGKLEDLYPETQFPWTIQTTLHF